MAGYSSDKKKKDKDKDKKKGKTTPTAPAEEFQPDLSNPFDAKAQLGLQNQLGGMAGLWGAGGGRGGTDQTAALQELMALWQQQQIRPEEAYMAQAKARDPAGFAQQQYQARMNADPWGPGGAFEGRGAAAMTPEALIASQGNSAENQWAQLGGNKGVNPEELRRLNAAAQTGGSGSVGLPISPEEMAEFDRQAALRNRSYV